MTRWFTAIVLIAAGAMGLWMRLETQTVDRSASPARDTLVGLQLSDGSVIETILSDPFGGVGLRPAECFDLAFLFPLGIEEVSSGEVLQQSFKSSGYKFIDVYQDRIQTESSRMSRIYHYLISTVGSGVTPNRDRFHVHIYIKPQCNVNERVLLDWASAVLSAWT